MSALRRCVQELGDVSGRVLLCGLCLRSSHRDGSFSTLKFRPGSSTCFSPYTGCCP